MALTAQSSLLASPWEYRGYVSFAPRRKYSCLYDDSNDFRPVIYSKKEDGQPYQFAYKLQHEDTYVEIDDRHLQSYEIVDQAVIPRDPREFTKKKVEEVFCRIFHLLDQNESEVLLNMDIIIREIKNRIEDPRISKQELIYLEKQCDRFQTILHNLKSKYHDSRMKTVNTRQLETDIKKLTSEARAKLQTILDVEAERGYSSDSSVEEPAVIAPLEHEDLLSETRVTLDKPFAFNQIDKPIKGFESADTTVDPISSNVFRPDPLYKYKQGSKYDFLKVLGMFLASIVILVLLLWFNVNP